MKFVNNDHDLFALACKAKNMHGLLLSFTEPDDNKHTSDTELRRAAPFLTEDQVWAMQENGTVFIFATTEKAIFKLFDQVVGDDGPTPVNDYCGSARIYAATVDSNGEWQTENT